MRAANKSAIFLVLTFAVSWSIVIGGWALGAARYPSGAVLALAGMMTGPAIAALLCAMYFERGRRMEALGLRFKPNWWWLIAYLIAVALCAASVGVTLLLSDRELADLQAVLLSAIEGAGQDASQLPAGVPLVPLVLFQALVMGALINSVLLTFSEELGWRGYLHALWRPLGFWRTSLATGVIWGVWHAPAIYLYGHNYPDNRLLGVGLFVVFCTLLSPIMTLVRDRGGSVWAAGILHGTINAVAGLSILWITNPVFPWNGLLGIGGFIVLVLGVLLVLAVQLQRPQRLASS